MKFTDDYGAKYRLWLAHPRVMPWSKPEGLPRFQPQKFSNHAEFNAWKQALIAQIAVAAGVAKVLALQAEPGVRSDEPDLTDSGRITNREASE